MTRRLTTEEFIEKAKATHKNKYDYSKVNYINTKTKVCIICPEHGEFWQTPSHHIVGCGCPKCGGTMKLTTEEFIDRAKKVHNGKYDYSRTTYITAREKVCIICPEHGEFWQVPDAHLNGSSCPKCSGVTSMTKDEFIAQARTIHGDKYDYSNVEYVNNGVEVCIICPEHGEFWQVPRYHIIGHGCQKCGGTKKSNTKDFIAKAKEIHGDKYDYSKVEYVNTKTKVCIICPEHGEFWQCPTNHLKGCGCSKCGKMVIGDSNRITQDEFLKKAKTIHGSKYDYSKVEYKKSNEKVCIICPEHGEFWQTPNGHLMGSGCPACACCYSKPETEIFELVKTLCSDVEQGNRTILNGFELDIYVPSKKIAIEYNGLRWHSEEFGKDAKYHLWKTEECTKQGIQLIHLFEDEWLEKQEIVKSRLKNIFGVTEKTIYARKCDVHTVPYNESRKFLNENHIQGDVTAKYRYGLYYNGELVSLMTFGKMRQQRKYHENYDSCYELLRFCSKLNTNVVGAAGKLLNAFLRDLKPSEVISYADRRWSQGNLYKQLSFRHTHDSKPNYFYVINDRRENRFKYRKGALVKEGYDPNKSEREIMLERGIYRIYDCGTMVFKLTNENCEEAYNK